MSNPAKAHIARFDAWRNAKSGLGTSLDRHRDTRWVVGPGDLLNRSELESLFRFNALARRIINKPPEVALKRGIDTENDELKAALKVNRVYDHLRRARRSARLYGGCLLVLVTAKDEDPAVPISPGDVDVRGFRMFTRYQVSQTVRNNLGEDVQYVVSEIGNRESAGTTMRIHKSRVWKFQGVGLNEHIEIETDGWGDSYLQGVWDQLRDAGVGISSAVTQLHRASFLAWSIRGLHQMLTSGPDGSSAIQAWMETTESMLSVINGALLDADGESVNVLSMPLGESMTVYEGLQYELAAALGWPITELYGREPSGLNATGESDQERWHELIEEEERAPLADCLDSFIIPHLVGGEDVEWEWPPLNRNQDELDATKLAARSSLILEMVDRGVITQTEARRSLVASGLELEFDEAEFSNQQSLLAMATEG